MAPALARGHRDCAFIDALPILPKKHARIVGLLAGRTTYVPTIPPRLSLATTSSSEKTPLIEAESSIIRARKTYPTSYEPAKVCLAPCLAEAARGAEVQQPGGPIVEEILKKRFFFENVLRSQRSGLFTILTCLL